MYSSGSKPRIGIDLGGTKTEVLALSGKGETLLRKRVPTPSHSYRDIIQTVAGLAAEARAITGTVAHIGIGVPGAPDQNNGRMKNANTTCLIGQPLASDLAAAIGCPVKLENDANCFTLSEAIDGAARKHRVVFGVILGTGVGGGWVINRELHRGMHHIAGEWGHNPVPIRTLARNAQCKASLDGQISDVQSALHGRLNGAPFVDLGRNCYCGLTDCIETHLCGSGLKRTYAWVLAHSRHSSDLATNQRDGRMGHLALSGEQIAKAAQAGDPACLQTLDLYSRQLASALATVINVIDPDAIVLGGGVSNIALLYDRVRLALSDYVFNDRANTLIVKAMHGDSSGVRGAAWL